MYEDTQKDCTGEMNPTLLLRKGYRAMLIMTSSLCTMDTYKILELTRKALSHGVGTRIRRSSGQASLEAPLTPCISWTAQTS